LNESSEIRILYQTKGVILFGNHLDQMIIQLLMFFNRNWLNYVLVRGCKRLICLHGSYWGLSLMGGGTLNQFWEHWSP